MRTGTQEELNRITSNSWVTNRKMCSGNPLGNNQQYIVYEYKSMVVATKLRQFRGNKEKSVDIQVNPLFLEHDADKAYDLHLAAV